MLNFIASCMVHKSRLIRFIAINAIYCARQNSLFSHNTLFRVKRCNCSFNDNSSGHKDYSVKHYCDSLLADKRSPAAFFCHNSLLSVTGESMYMTVVFLNSELCVISYNCTSKLLLYVGY